MTLQDVKRAQPNWFSRDNKRFFNDVEYRVLHGKKTKKPYLVRLTGQWSDMFGGQMKYRYRINPLDPQTAKIENLLDVELWHYDDVKEWMQEN